jgi:hypothetical protein
VTRVLSRRAAGSIVAALILTGCEQPLRASNPAPLDAAAARLDIPPSLVSELERTASALARSTPPSAGLDAPADVVDRLKGVLAVLERSYAPPGTAQTP